MALNFCLNRRFSAALKPSGVHFSISLFFAAGVALIIFLIWFPWPIYEMTSGRGLFWLIVSVDVVCGPILTFVVWSDKKSKRELILDVGLISLVQLMALGYGLYVIASARPVHIVFETDRLRVVTASEIDPMDLSRAPRHYRNLPWTGPTLLSIREARDGDEFLKSVELSLAGKEPSVRPDWWQPYENGISDLLTKARPLIDILEAKPEQESILQKAISDSGISADELVWLPLTSGKSMEWIVLLDKNTGMPKSYAPIDGFF